MLWIRRQNPAGKRFNGIALGSKHRPVTEFNENFKINADWIALNSINSSYLLAITCYCILFKVVYITWFKKKWKMEIK